MDISSEQMAFAVGTRLGRTQLRVDTQTAFTCPVRKSYPDVLVMQPSQDRNGEMTPDRRLAKDQHLVQALPAQCAQQ